MRKACFLLLAILLSVAASQGQLVAREAGELWIPSLSPSSFGPVQKAICSCEDRCGECGGRLRGCFNGIPFCECFRC